MLRPSPSLLLQAYAMGLFPMAESGSDQGELMWFDPDPRGILPLDGLIIPRRLRRLVRQGRFVITADTAFEVVIAACAETTPIRPNTWINRDIARLYTALHQRGFAHSIEVRHEDRLVGGLYGVALGRAFFGESMFSREANASKVALVHLVARLRAGGFTLLDTQFLTAHLARFGAVEIPKDEYHRRLAAALVGPADFSLGDDDRSAVAAVLAQAQALGQNQTDPTPDHPAD
ncbi:Leucyl/phenylalanyl-tRNA--protein transferase [uncultured Gammaproteobacteria bacterium]